MLIRKIIITILIIVLYNPVLADSRSNAANDYLSINPINISAILNNDLNSDNNIDKAVLISNQNRGTADLYIYLFTPEGLKLNSYKRDFIWSDTSYGTLPELSMDEGNNLIVTTRKDGGTGNSLGWESYTIKYMDGDFYIIKFDFLEVDRRNLEEISCSLNWKTGIGMINSNRFKIVSKVIKIEDWIGRSHLGYCFK